MSKVNKALDIASGVVEEVGPVRALKSIWDSIVSSKMENVFQNCAEQLGDSGHIEDKFKEKLDSYIESEFGQETVYSLVHKSVTADSKECCKILGVLMGKAMNENRPLTQQERVISEALKSLTDYDLDLLKKLYTNVGRIPPHPELVKQAAGDQAKLKQELARNSLSIHDFYDHGILTGSLEDDFYSIERMKRLDVMTAFAVHGGRAKSSTQGLFKFNQISVEIVILSLQVVKSS